MDTSTTIDLIKETFAADAIGQLVATETSRTILARISSVSASEFFAAGESGFKPELRATIFAPNYQGEALVSYGGARYSVYRTYTKGDNIELYLEKRVSA